MKLLSIALLLFSSIAAAAEVDMTRKPASASTLAAQAQVRTTMPVDDGQDASFVHHGFIAAPTETKVYNRDGKLVWDMALMNWVTGEAPDTVNPSLWRQMSLLKEYGLYKIADNVWQARGFDMSNMEIIAGKTGWIIVDPLMTTETAAAALKFVNQQLGERPVSAIIYGHSHADHFGGVRAVVAPGTHPAIVAPSGAVVDAATESVLAGNVMSRRAAMQMGLGLQADPRGYVGSGILIETAVDGTTTILPPTDEIKQTGDTRVIDGVRFEFQMVPETEAPSEMNFFLPDSKTLYVSEDTTCTLHNIQTPRGALVRDANKWAGYITEALNLYGDRVETLVTGHCWPRYGNAAITKYLALQRDNYKFIHDQTLRMANAGLTPTAIADTLKQPKALSDQWSNHGYYGTLQQNAKGVFQRYIGWWDGIPAHLNLLPPAEQSRRYVDAMGGAKGVLKLAKRAMAQGDYRWSAEVLNHLVFADPANKQAKALLADSYEQLGYQTESGIWRNFYLTGANELRHGVRPFMSVGSVDVINAMPTASFLDLVAARLNPTKIGNAAMTLLVDDGGNGHTALVTLRNSVLINEIGKSAPNPTVSVGGPRMMLAALFIQKAPLASLEKAGLKIDGDRTALANLLDAIEPPPRDFPVVTP